MNQPATRKPARPGAPGRGGRPGAQGGRGPGGQGGEGQGNRRHPRGDSTMRGERQESEWQEKVIQVRRVTKVVKGGKNLSFSALVVIGDLKGNIGFGHGKAAEVSDAIRKAVENAKKALIKLPFDQGSIPHNVVGKFGSTEVHLFRAPKGTGLIACWSIKMALESAGLHNLVCKTIGSTNPSNVMSALADAIKNLKTKGQIKILRSSIAGAHHRRLDEEGPENEQELQILQQDSDAEGSA
ncbi:MAG: 30S ribosomal protein S5 [Candidatus Caenarcaniphilales bacterium]|nr:30S ribosomal protein S5 [Candidatus Caenarcaniphilales bacterium]